MIRAQCPDPLEMHRIASKTGKRMRYFASFLQETPQCEQGLADARGFLRNPHGASRAPHM